MSAHRSQQAQRPAGRAELVLLWLAITVVVVAVGGVTAAVHIANSQLRHPAHLPGNPFTLVGDLARGRLRWPAQATVYLVVIAAAALALLAIAGAIVARARRGRHPVDRAARWMGVGAALAPLTEKGAAATAERLGVSAPGLPIARTMNGGMLYASWEDVQIDVAGPRVGKTISRAIPSVLAAPGAVFATSNKRDIVDATRGPRGDRGPVWVFDPQQLIDEPQTWWWNPLSYVTDEVRAAQLADVFALANRDPGARIDAFFDSAGQTLVGHLLHAAALANRPLTQVYTWVTRPNDEEPALILADHRLPLQAEAVQAVVHAPEKQRGGIYGTAQEMCSFMTNRAAMRWVAPNPGQLPLDLGSFVRGTGTLYSLSREGRGSAAALVTSLTVALTDAAEQYAKASPHGRLSLPIVGVLDEAANVCRWRELPDLYSHYGSRSICLMTILQSWSQGVEVWGRDGMRKLWSAANIKVYGGGVSEVEFLNELSSLIGDFELRTASTTHSPGRGGGRSTSYSTRPERILDVSTSDRCPRAAWSCSPRASPRSWPGPSPGWTARTPPRSGPRSRPTPARTSPPPPPLPPRRPNLARRRPTTRGCARERPGRMGRARGRRRRLAERRRRRRWGSRRRDPAASPLLRPSGGLRRRLPGEDLPTQPQRAQHRVVPGMVAPPRGLRSAGGAVARLGAPAPRSRHRHVGVVQRPRRPPHGRPAVLRRPVQGLRGQGPRRAPARAAASGHATGGTARPRRHLRHARRSER